MKHCIMDPSCEAAIHDENCGYYSTHGVCPDPSQMHFTGAYTYDGDPLYSSLEGDGEVLCHNPSADHRFVVG